MPSALDMARTVLGKSEGKDRAALMDYLKTGGQNLDPQTTAWCAAFVNSSLQQAGYSGTGSNLARSFMEWGNAVEGTPQAGDIAVYPRGNNPTQGHVGFVEAVDPKTGMVTLLGGNQGDAVSENQRAMSAALGYRRAAGLPSGSYAEGPKGQEAYPPPVTATTSAGPVEAAGGGAGSETGATAAPAVAAATQPKPKSFAAKFAEGLGDVDFSAKPAPASSITDLPRATLAAGQPTTFGATGAPGSADDLKRQQLALVMQRLNSQRLF